MSKKVLIADPDASEARKQAAILSDAGHDVQTFTGSDIFAALDAAIPDLLVLRHERGGQGGLAWVNRIRRQNRYPGVTLILTTSDLVSESIQEHQNQPYHADVYVRLPVSRTELEEAALVQAPLPTSISDDEPPAPPPLLDEDPPAPPPLAPPPMARAGPLEKTTGTPTPEPREDSLSFRPSPRGEKSELGTSELKFVEDVFDSIRENDGEAPRDETPLPRTGPDRKLALLRRSLREYEYKLGKLKGLWRTRETQLAKSQYAIEKERTEVDGLRLRITEVEAELGAQKAAMAAQAKQLGAAMTEQYDDAALREAEALQQVAAQQYKAHRLDNELQALKRTHTDLQRTLSERVLNWERAYKELEGFHWSFVDASGAELSRVEQQVRHREASLGQRREDARNHAANQALFDAQKTQTRSDLFRQTHAHQESVDALLREHDIQLRLKKRDLARALSELAAGRAQIVSLEEALFKSHGALRMHHRGLLRGGTRIAQKEQEARKTIAYLEARLDVLQTGSQYRESLLSRERSDAEELIFLQEQHAQREALIAQANLEHFRERSARAEEALEHTRAELAQTLERLSHEEEQHTEQYRRAETLMNRLDSLNRDSSETQESLEQKLSKKTQAFEQLQASHEKLSIHAATLGQEHDALREKFDEVSEDFAQSTDNYGLERKKFLDRITMAKRELAMSREDEERLKDTLKNREARIAEQLDNARQSDQTVLALESQNKRLYTQIAEFTASRVAFGERESAHRDSLKMKDEEVRAAQLFQSELRTVLAQAEREKESMQRAHDELEQRLEDREIVALASKEKEREDVLALAEQREENSLLARQLDEARAELQLNATFMEDLQAEVDAAAAQRKSGGGLAMERLRQELDGLRAENRELMIERESFDAERASFSRMEGGEGISDEIRALQKEASDRERHFASELRDRDESIADLEARLRLAQEARVAKVASPREERLEQELRDKREELKGLLFASNSERQKADERIEALQSRLEKLSAADQRASEELMGDAIVPENIPPGVA